MKSRMSSKFDQISPWSVELAALEHLKKSFTYMYLRTIQNIFMTCWLAGERSLPFGLLVDTDYCLKILLTTDFLDVEFND